MVAILAAAFLASWIAQGLTFAILRENSSLAAASDLIERELPIGRHDRITVYLTPVQNLIMLTAQGAHILLGLTTVTTLLAVCFTYQEPKSRAEKTIKPLSLDSRHGPEETPRP
ncbi:MAG: hypothetical protein J7515_13600 [Caulobacter sp.]|nr:hypothetical protein [Caulobacter sp.]